MHIAKRGLLALTALAMVGTTTGVLAASAASAGATRGHETVTGTQYAVGNGFGVGPWNGRGVINTGGVVTDIASAPTDPPNTNRHTLQAPNGSFTVITDQGTQGPFSMNSQTCAVKFLINDVEVNLVPGTGTGIYAHATGHFDANLVIKGFALETPQGCDTNQNDPLAFTSTAVVAKGYIDLH